MIPSLSEVVPAPSSGSRRRAASRPTSPPRPCFGGIVLGCGVSERHDPEPIASTRREMPDRDRHALGDVRLPAIGGAELHRQRGVEHQPGDEHALGEVDAHMRLVRPRGHVPVDPPHVVAGRVRAHHGELGAGSEQVRAEVAREQPLHPPRDRDVERLQQPFRHRPRARARGARRGEKRVRGSRGLHAAFMRARSSCGAGTAASTWSRIASGLTSSASAW